MRVAFAGTPEFAAVALQRLLNAGFTVPLVLTQPDRPAGRGMKLQASPVKQFALEHGIAVAQPRSLRLDGKFPDDAAAVQSAIQAANADAMVLFFAQSLEDRAETARQRQQGGLLPRQRAEGTGAVGARGLGGVAAVGADAGRVR